MSRPRNKKTRPVDPRGAAQSETGTWVCCKLSCQSPGEPVSPQWASYESDRQLLAKNIFRPLSIAVSSVWHCTDERRREFQPHIAPDERQHLHQQFGSNCLELVAAETYLHSLPTYFCKECPGDFYSHYSSAECLWVSISRDGVQQAVLQFPPGSLSASLRRISRYLPQGLPGIGFNFNDPAQSSLNFQLPEFTTVEQLQSFGAAIKTMQTMAQPNLPSQINTHMWLLRARKSITAIALTLVILSAAVTIGLHFWANSLEQKAASIREHYQQSIIENQQLQSQRQKLHDQALHLQSIQQLVSSQTNWSGLLNQIISAAPPQLYLEKMGSRGELDSLKVAISGWTSKEELVTEFLGALNSSKLITATELRSINPSEKDTRTKDFLIECSVSIQ